jgi:hypothetical protein
MYTDPSGHIFGIDDLLFIGIVTAAGAVHGGTNGEWFGYDQAWNWNGSAQGALEWGGAAATLVSLNNMFFSNPSPVPGVGKSGSGGAEAFLEGMEPTLSKPVTAGVEQTAGVTHGISPVLSKPMVASQGNVMFVNRFLENSVATMSTFSVSKAGVTDGYILEPPGGTYTQAISKDSGVRILEGSYKMVPHSGPKFQGVYALEGANLGNRTAVLMHVGNYPSNTSACLLPGLKMGYNAVSYSQNALNMIKNYIGDTGTMIIKNSFSNPLKM